MDEATVHTSVNELHALLPFFSARLAAMPPADVARMALTRLDAIAACLLALRQLLPQGDLGRIVAGCPQLLTQPLEEPRATLAHVQGLLGGGEGLMALLKQQPALLEPGVAATVCEELERLFGVEDVAGRVRMLQRDPSLVVALQPLRNQV